MQSLLQQIAQLNNFSLQSFESLSGGDINHVYVLQCVEKTVVIKLNKSSSFPKMFETEAKGLELLKSSKSFKIPNVLAIGTLEDWSYLLLEYMPPGTATDVFWTHFAENLTTLHGTSSAYFGLPYNNYIGSLQQYNAKTANASEFYITQRLEPQFKLAAQNGYVFTNISNFYHAIVDEIPNEPPSLVHGDLWAGNFLVSEINAPVLIDPAVAFASREMDLAMMQLFGGFPQHIFSEYNEIFPLQKNWEKRISIFQLYYLLVHLNLFGRGYLKQVQSIIGSFS